MEIFLIGNVFRNTDFVAHNIGFFLWQLWQAAIYEVIKHHLHGTAALLVGVLVEGGFDKPFFHHFDGTGDGIEGHDDDVFAAGRLNGTGRAVAAGGYDKNGVDFRIVGNQLAGSKMALISGLSAISWRAAS